MARRDKPYRVYRGGRVKGPAGPLVPKERRQTTPERDGRYRGPGPVRRKRRGVRRLLVGLALVLLVAALVWGALGFLAFRSGVSEANDRLPDGTREALTGQAGIPVTTATNVLVLGTDSGRKDREGPGRSDTVMLIRTDPRDNRVARLSIPRDLRVDIPGVGTDKINAAYAHGGAPLAVATVEHLTGLEVNHVVMVDFEGFGHVIDALGGVTIDVPRPILSNKFDCPKRTPAECVRWQGWRFRAGPQTMNGRRALIYARIRQNRLAPNESDFTRVRRQQQVVQAVQDEAVSFRTYLRGPFVGDDLARPLATDLSAGELLQLAWVQKRAPSSQTLNCNLGGESVFSGGVFYIQGSEENVSVVAMVTGDSAPQPPPPGSGPFGPGCRVGS